MRGVGYKLPPNLLCLLEPIRQRIELIGKYCEFILTLDLHPVLIVAVLHPPNGLQQALILSDDHQAKHNVQYQ